MRAFIVTGDRNAQKAQWDRPIRSALAFLDLDHDVSVCIHGDARGIDSIAAGICRWWDADIQLIPMPYIASEGKAGGPIRNMAMLDVLKALQKTGYAVAVHAFHDDLEGSKGTRNMVSIACKAGITTFVHGSNGTTRKVAA